MYKDNLLRNQILYEDKDIIIINKYPTQLVQSDKEKNSSLLDHLKDYLGQNPSKNSFCEAVHRLDRPVSGIVLFAKNKHSLSYLNRQFQDKQVQKIYWAIVRKKTIDRSKTLIDYIVKNETINKSYIVKAGTKNALKAELDYQFLAESDHYILLEVRPKTGRHHQIRLQLANLGCPIKGDLKYGYNRSNKDSSISLHARKIIFTHPSSDELISFTADVPEDSLWKYFDIKLNSIH